MYSLDLHRALRDGNGAARGMAWSPYSVWCSLGMAAIGARGRTADEMAAVLTPGHAADELTSMLESTPDLTYTEGTATLAMANTAWLQASFEIEHGYLATMKQWTAGDIRSIDFEAHPESARHQINSNVRESTHGLITDLIADGAIDEDTRLVLVNALYLHAQWAETFFPKATDAAIFQSPDGPRSVAMMHGAFKASYANQAGWQAVGLRTRSSHASVTILLPDGELGQAEDELTPQLLLELHDQLTPANVTLALPRLHAGLNLDVKPLLKQMGVRLAFSDEADFSGIARREPLQIGFVAHETVLSIDEAGIEAAAATATGIRTVSAMVAPSVTVTVDRPFLATVRDPNSGMLLFLGRITDPDPPDAGPPG